jgi:phosphoribosylformylglycinamidine synthase II
VETLDLEKAASKLQQQLKKYRLRESEYELMKKTLGREPRPIEWALFSALWSEHCSYKSSKVHLKKFKWAHPRVLTAEGENAGVVDLGEGERIAFKMESHNHPSFIEPFHGAATGVGGILRDIFTMGARPIALANYLCFGEAEAPRMKTLMRQVVKGISFYGNCVGVPTVTGATYSLPDYNQNILVNAFALGLFDPHQKLTISKASGVGNWVVYVGAQTGSDGVHGASMASESFTDDNESKRPTVQIGDPFYEKLLIEACLEILDQDLVVAMQDMGAAGLTSSSFEMASRGQVGLRLDLDRVPLRDSRLGPEEILLSESQERMLLVCEPRHFESIQKIFSRWGLESVKIGEVVEGREIELRWKGETLTQVDPALLVEKAPQYQRPYQKLNLANKKSQAPSSVRNSGSKKWIYRQYDQRVGLRTWQEAGHPVALLRLESGRSLAVALGCRPWLMKEDPVLGAYDSVFEPALKMVIQGAWPVAITDCLNFGNPEKPEIMSEFVASVEALAESARLWDAPVISGNVSFYNETEGKNIPSTPATGVVGLKKANSPRIFDEFPEAGLNVALLTMGQASSKFQVTGFDPQAVVEEAKKLFEGIERGLFISARLVGERGLHHCLRKMAATLNLVLETPRGEPWDPFEETSAVEDETSFSGSYQIVLAYHEGQGAEIHRVFSHLQPLGKTQKTSKSANDQKGTKWLLQQELEFKETWGIT